MPLDEYVAEYLKAFGVLTVRFKALAWRVSFKVGFVARSDI